LGILGLGGGIKSCEKIRNLSEHLQIRKKASQPEGKINIKVKNKNE